MSGVQLVEVTQADADLRFDRWCRRHYPKLAHGLMQRLLRTGQFRLDGKRVKPADRVVAGQIVRVPPQATSLPKQERNGVSQRDAEFIQSLVVYEDQDIIAINKPAGLAVQGGSKTTRHIDGMLDALAHKGERPKLVHRLDRDTTGTLILARNRAVARQLMFAFQQHQVRKLYWAIVVGRPQRHAGMIDLELGKSGAPGQERVSPNALGAKAARTDFRVIARAGKVGAWVGMMPETGRTHQLRAHMAAVGTPILGDHKYGGEHPSTAPTGLMLHAYEIEIPLSRKRIRKITCEPPQSFKDGLGWLGLSIETLPFSRIEDWNA